MSIPKKNKNQETPRQKKKDEDREREINFIFNFALAIYGVSLSLSAVQAHYANIFTPSEIIFSENFVHLGTTVAYGIFILLTVSIFAYVWYHRNGLWNKCPFNKDCRLARAFKVISAFVLGISPWLVYYLTYGLKYSIHLIP
jgi:hypothetical protein